MKPRKPKYTNAEIRIIKILYQFGRPMTTYSIVGYVGYSYTIVRKYLKRLYSKRRLHKKKSGKSTYWWLRSR